MKRYGIVCALFFSSLICNGWEYELVNKISVIATRPVVLPNGDILIAYTTASLVTGQGHSEEILRLSSEGEFKGITDFTNHFPDLDFHATSLTYNYNYLIYTGYGYDSIGMVKPFLIKMTEDLDVIFDTIYNYEGAFKESYPISDSGYFISALSGDLIDNYRCYWRLDKNFGIDTILVDSMKYAPNDFGWSTCDTKREYIYYFSAYNCTLFKYNAQSLNSVDSHFCSFQMETFPFVNNEGNILMTGLNYYIWPSDEHLNIALFDSNLNVVDSLFYKDSELPNRSASGYSICQQNSFYYIGATDNFSATSSIMDATEQRPFMLLKTDKHLNLIWARKYRDDCSYWMNDVVATKDGGVLMVGARWNWPEDSLKKEVSMYILKVDSGGVITGTGEDIVKEPNFTMYPNPNTGSFTLQNSGNQEGYIRISNLQGQEVFLSEFDSGPVHFITTNLRPGLYIATVFQQKKVFTTRFIIK